MRQNELRDLTPKSCPDLVSGAKMDAQYPRASITSLMPSLNVCQDRMKPTFCELVAWIRKSGASPNLSGA